MARTANTPLKNVTQRNKLEARTAPYWESINPGRLLGLIAKGADVRGSWVVRVLDENGLRRREVFGSSCILKDEADANGTDILSYAQAFAFASSWSLEAAAAAEAAASAFTVRDAVLEHKDFGGKKGKKSDVNKQRAFDNLRFNVLRLEGDGKGGATGAKRDDKGIGHIVINALTTAQLVALRQVWIDENGEPTALRNWSNLHSCLERFAANPAHGITNQAVWRTEENGGTMPSMDQDFEGRLVHFSNADALAIIAHARQADSLVADYLEALYRTGARPGKEVFTLAAGDFNPALRRISIRAGKTGPRPQVQLDAHGVALFARLTAGQASNVRIFADLDGDPRRVKAVLLAAIQAVNPLLPEGVAQEDVVPYAFRHTFISRRLEAGAQVSMIAKHVGNSVYIIEKTYAHFCPSALADMIEATAPQATVQLVKNAA